MVVVAIAPDTAFTPIPRFGGERAQAKLILQSHLIKLSLLLIKFVMKRADSPLSTMYVCQMVVILGIASVLLQE